MGVDRTNRQAMLTAYALGELPDADVHEIETLLKTDSEARLWVERVRALAETLQTEFRNEPLPSGRLTIEEIQSATPSGRMASWGSRWREAWKWALLAPTASVAVIVLIFSLTGGFEQLAMRPKLNTQAYRQEKLLRDRSEAEPSAGAAVAPQITSERTSGALETSVASGVSANLREDSPADADQAMAERPVPPAASEPSSLPGSLAIAHALRAGRWPSPAQVSLAAMLEGLTWTRSRSVDSHPWTLDVEISRAPWNPSHVLAWVKAHRIESQTKGVGPVSVWIRFDSRAVASYRRLGTDSRMQRPAEPVSMGRLDEARSNSIVALFEIEPVKEPQGLMAQLQGRRESGVAGLAKKQSEKRKGKPQPTSGRPLSKGVFAQDQTPSAALPQVGRAAKAASGGTALSREAPVAPGDKAASQQAAKNEVPADGTTSNFDGLDAALEAWVGTGTVSDTGSRLRQVRETLSSVSTLDVVSNDARATVAVVSFGLLLRGEADQGRVTYADLISLLEASLLVDGRPDPARLEWLDLIRLAQDIRR